MTPDGVRAAGMPPVSPREKPLAGCRLPEKREAAPAALQTRLSGYGVMSGYIRCSDRVMQ
ncbi:hypothetical protein D6N07_20325 [Salmonella enterica]|nr:hypothetical protein [Salmonella enterica]